VQPRATFDPSQRAAASLGLNEVLVLDSVVRPDEQSVLASWALERHRAGALLNNPVDPRRHLTPYLAAEDRGRTPLTQRQPVDDGDAGPVWIPEITLGHADTPPDDFWQIRRRVIDRLGLGEARDDPYKGSFLTYVTSGGFVHAHRDARLQVEGMTVPLLRCNVMLRRATRGGQPVISERELEVPVRGMWAFYPTELLHSATPVSGARGRVTLSFGFVIDPRTVWERPFHVRPGVEPALIDDLRRQLRRTALSEARATTLDHILTRQATFCVRDVADAVDRDPWDVWKEARRLQAMSLVQSLSPAIPGEARLLVL
jgi:hypothetical protein